MLKKIDLLFVIESIEDAEAEFEQLMYDNNWFVTEVNDKLKDAKARVREHLNEITL